MFKQNLYRMRCFTLLAAVPVIICSSFIVPMFLQEPAFAQFNPKDSLCQGSQSNSGATAGTCTANGNSAVNNLLKTGISILMYAVGFGAVVMIIIAAFQYVTSGGDSAAVGKAKNSIMYAIIGIIISLSAFAIVTFVYGAVK